MSTGEALEAAETVTKLMRTWIASEIPESSSDLARSLVNLRLPGLPRFGATGLPELVRKCQNLLLWHVKLSKWSIFSCTT